KARCWKWKSQKPAKSSSKATRSAASTALFSRRRRLQALRKRRRCRLLRKRHWPARLTRAPRVCLRRRTSNSCSLPTASFAGKATPLAGSPPARKCCDRVCASSPTNSSPAPRDAVQARLDLWLKTHIEKLLGPLFALAAADNFTGIARGVAFQLAEALGVLERQKVAEDMKGLDQPARATLRKHGVRFGAYHIYLPALLKPAPRLLAAQLWLLKNAAPDDKGLDELRQLASGGRTSIPINPEIAKPLYRALGYRACGARAVRVDILERLADLIRPALAWREGSAQPKPAGAVAGGFTATSAMTSLTGSSGEDFASILRALGYRLER